MLRTGFFTDKAGNGQFGETHVQLMNMKPGCVFSILNLYSNEYVYRRAHGKVKQSTYRSHHIFHASTCLLGYMTCFLRLAELATDTLLGHHLGSSTKNELRYLKWDFQFLCPKHSSSHPAIRIFRIANVAGVRSKAEWPLSRRPQAT